MGDLIDRQAAIDALMIAPQEWDGMFIQDLNVRIRKKIEALPSAQPTEASCWGCNCQKMERLKEQKTFSEMVHLHDAETHEERTETHACDLISRQAAVKAIENTEWYHLRNNGVMMHGANSKEHQAWYKEQDIYKALEQLPSAQPEPEELDFVQPHKKVGVRLEVGQPDMSEYSDKLWKAAYERGKAEAQRKKGKWIEYDNSHCECPFCHEEWSYFDNETECFNYCPNCGAEMQGDADE